jgi:hypothetical protein
MCMLVTYTSIYDMYKSYVSPGWETADHAFFSLGYNGSLVIWTVVCLTATKFKPLVLLHAVGQQWKRCLQPLLGNATIEGTVVFFVVRSGNDVRQQWADWTVKVFSLLSVHRLYKEGRLPVESSRSVSSVSVELELARTPWESVVIVRDSAVKCVHCNCV